MEIKKIFAIALATVAMVSVGADALAQEPATSTARMRRGARDADKQQNAPGVTTRMQQRLSTTPTSDADMAWMKVIYRNLDLQKAANAPLYYPEQPIDGDANMFRIIMGLLAEGKIPAYEYLDGRELFNDENRVKVRELLDRYGIMYQDAKGSNERNPRFEIHESDIPSTEIQSYYIIERWEFDSRSNRMQTRVEAVCPVLHRSDDYGMESLKYPMFWIKYDDLRPYLTTRNIFISDANNKPSCTYDDYFQLGLYDGEIYKTRNLRNRSMKQLYPNPDDMARAQDSIQKELDSFENKLWVPTLEELAARREAREGADSTVVAATDKGKAAVSKRGQSRKAPAKAKTKRGQNKKAKAVKNSSTSAPTRSVRNRKR